MIEDESRHAAWMFFIEVCHYPEAFVERISDERLFFGRPHAATEGMMEPDRTGAQRLLIISDSYPPLVGGATRAAEQLALGMQGLGWQVQVATAWQQGSPDKEVLRGIPVARLRSVVSRIGAASADPFRYTPPPFPDPELAWRLRKLIREFNPTLVHSYGWITYSALVAVPRRVPLAVSARDYGYVCPKRTLLRFEEPCSGPEYKKCLACAPEFYGRPKSMVATFAVLSQRAWLRSRMDSLHSCSGFMQDLMEDYLLRGQKHDLAANVVIPDFHPEDETLPEVKLTSLVESLPATPFILFVGALRRAKGVEILLKAYAGLRNPRPPLVLIGSTAPDTPPIPPDVTVLHDLPFPAILEAWRRCLFGVCPSIWPEPLGNVVHEGMSQAKAVIGTVPGGHASMIRDGVSGLLVQSGNLEQLRDAMTALIDDEELRETLGHNVSVHASEFTAEVGLPLFRDFYEVTMHRERSIRPKRRGEAAPRPWA